VPDLIMFRSDRFIVPQYAIAIRAHARNASRSPCPHRYAKRCRLGMRAGAGMATARGVKGRNCFGFNLFGDEHDRPRRTVAATDEPTAPPLILTGPSAWRGARGSLPDFQTTGRSPAPLQTLGGSS
jgi:hypothetical protein